MSLDVYLEVVKPSVVFESNITHNLTEMAEAAGIYQHLWQPDKNDITHAKQLIEPLQKALKLLKDNPDEYRKYNAHNRWGTYDDFVPWVEQYLAACIENPDATVTVSS